MLLKKFNICTLNIKWLGSNPIHIQLFMYAAFKPFSLLLSFHSPLNVSYLKPLSINNSFLPPFNTFPFFWILHNIIVFSLDAFTWKLHPHALEELSQPPPSYISLFYLTLLSFWGTGYMVILLMKNQGPLTITNGYSSKSTY